MSSPEYTVGGDGAIIMKPIAPPAEPKPMNMMGSAIQAAAANVDANRTAQVGALKVLGGKMSGGRYRRHKGGAQLIEVKTLPQATTAGTGPHPNSVFAGMLQLKAQAAEGGKYDGLGNAPPRQVSVGGRRKTRRKVNARRIRLHSRKTGRSLNRTRRLRYSGRRLRRLR
jgi:hypothetical protein